MRLPIALSVLATGCAILDGAQVPLVAVHPSRLYLHPLETISVRWNADLDDYACIDGPIVCAKVGIGWDCRCP